MTLKALGAAFDAKREEMYGPNWRDLDWWGRPIQPPPAPSAPTEYREDIHAHCAKEFRDGR